MSSTGNLPLLTEKADSSIGSLDSGFDSQSMDLEDNELGEKGGKRMSPHAPSTSPELLKAVKKSKENSGTTDKVSKVEPHYSM